MDLRRLRAGEWIAGVSGVVLFVSLFLPWYRQEPRAGMRDDFFRELQEQIGSTDISAFEVYSVVDILLVLVAGLGVAVFLAVAMQRSAAVGIALEALVAVISGVVAIVVLVRVLNLPDEFAAFNDSPRNPFEISRTAWIALGPVATLGVCVGSLVAMRDERLSKPGHPTDSAGAPAEPRPIEVIRSP